MKWVISVSSIVYPQQLLLIENTGKKKSFFKKSHRYHKRSFRKYHPEPGPSKPKFYKKRFSNSKPKSTKDKSQIRCYKCKKLGHYSSECRVKENINSLDILHSEKTKLYTISKLKDSSGSDLDIDDLPTSSSDSSTSSSETDSATPNQNLGCQDRCCKVSKTLNVIREQEELLIDLIFFFARQKGGEGATNVPTLPRRDHESTPPQQNI